jgi:hypothetical protein
VGENHQPKVNSISNFFGKGHPPVGPCRLHSIHKLWGAFGLERDLSLTSMHMEGVKTCFVCGEMGAAALTFAVMFRLRKVEGSALVES